MNKLTKTCGTRHKHRWTITEAETENDKGGTA